MNKADKLTKYAQEEKNDNSIFCEYFPKDLWSGSQQAKAGWYLRSNKFSPDENHGRGKWLGKNVEEAEDTLSASIY